MRAQAFIAAFIAGLAAVVGSAGASGGEASAKADYMLHCMGCHLADGSGNPPEVPDLRGEMGRLLAVEGGREYLVQVPGAAQAPIPDAALAAVVNYMLEAFSGRTLPEGYRPLTAEEVSTWRPHWLSDVASVRRRLLAALEGGAGEPAASGRGRRPQK